MFVKRMIEELSKLPNDANVIIIDENTGIIEGIDRVCNSEDPPSDGSSEVWIVKEES